MNAVALPSNRKELINIYSELVRCPLAWDIDNRFEGLPESVFYLWLKICREHQVDKESELFEFSDCGYIDEALEVYDDDYLYDCTKNVLRWIKSAYEEFENRYRLFFQLKTATDKEYIKHYVKKYTSEKELLNKSKNGVSYFYPSIGPGEIHEFIYSCLDRIAPYYHPYSEPSNIEYEEVWDRIFSGHNTKFAVDCLCNVGASQGKLVKYMAIEIDSSVNLAHAYPVGQKKAEEIMGSIGIPGVGDLKGYDQAGYGINAIEQRPFATLLPLSEHCGRYFTY